MAELEAGNDPRLDEAREALLRTAAAVVISATAGMIQRYEHPYREAEIINLGGELAAQILALKGEASDVH